MANAVGNSTELGRHRDIIGNSDSISFIFYGDNSAVNGNSIDLMPNVGLFTYELSNPITASDASALPLQASLDDPLGNAALKANLNALKIRDNGGVAGLEYWMLLMLAALVSIRSTFVSWIDDGALP